MAKKHIISHNNAYSSSEQKRGLFSLKEATFGKGLLSEVGNNMIRTAFISSIICLFSFSTMAKETTVYVVDGKSNERRPVVLDLKDIQIPQNQDTQGRIRVARLPSFIHNPSTLHPDQSDRSIDQIVSGENVFMGAGSSGGGDICLSSKPGEITLKALKNARMLDLKEHMPNERARINPYFIESTFESPSIDSVNGVCSQLALKHDGQTCVAVKNKMNEIYKNSPVLGELVISKFANSKWYFQSAIRELADEGEVKNCQNTIQLAIRVQLTDANADSMVVNVSKVFHAVSVETQVALIFHEIIYALLAQEAGDQTSQVAREMTASLFQSENMADMTSKVASELKGKEVVSSSSYGLELEQIEEIVKLSVMEACFPKKKSLLNKIFWDTNYFTENQKEASIAYDKLQDLKKVCAPRGLFKFARKNKKYKRAANLIQKELEASGSSLEKTQILELLKEQGKDAAPSILNLIAQ